MRPKITELMNKVAAVLTERERLCLAMSLSCLENTYQADLTRFREQFGTLGVDIAEEYTAS